MLGQTDKRTYAVSLHRPAPHRLYMRAVPIMLMKSIVRGHFIEAVLYERRSAYIPGGPKKCPELCVTITARILYGAKFPLAHL